MNLIAGIVILFSLTVVIWVLRPRKKELIFLYSKSALSQEQYAGLSAAVKFCLKDRNDLTVLILPPELSTAPPESQPVTVNNYSLTTEPLNQATKIDSSKFASA